jgi:hypothetical protein
MDNLPAVTPNPITREAIIEAREAEVRSYEKNMDMFQSILMTLPREWPEHLLQYRNAVNHHETAAKIDNLDDVALLADLWNADACYARIRTEMVELQKSRAALAYLKATLSAN